MLMTETMVAQARKVVGQHNRNAGDAAGRKVVGEFEKVAAHRSQ